MTSIYLTDQESVSSSDTISEAYVDSGSRVPPTKTPTYCTVEDFVAHVIYDGRFLKTFTDDPEAVAILLNVTISPEVVKQLRGRDRGQVLSQVTEKMTREYGERADLQGTIPDIHADFGISTAVVVGAIAIITIVIAGCGRTTVTDDSSDGQSKL